MYQQCGPELHAMFHPLFLYPPEYVNSHDDEITEEQKIAPTKSSSVDISVGRINALLAFDRRAGLASIKSPTLVLTCDNDYITPSYHAEYLVRAIPGAKLAIPKGGGHSFSKANPDEFNRIVLDFLADANQTRIEVQTMDGASISRLLEDIAKTDAAVLEQVRRIVEPAPMK